MIKEAVHSILLLFFLISLSSSQDDAKILHIQYFRSPVEYGYFKLTDFTGFNEWSTFIYSNHSVNPREDQILEDIKPIYDGHPVTRRFESISITRHFGVQMRYVLQKFKIGTIIMENPCSQMKPKFGLIMGNSTQKPEKIEFIIEHPSSSFTIPEGFRNGLGRVEYSMTSKGRASFDEENLSFEALRNTDRLMIRQRSEIKTGVKGDVILQIKAPHVLLEGENSMKDEQLVQLGKEWLQRKREIVQWEISLNNSFQNTTFYFERDGQTLEVRPFNGIAYIVTYVTPAKKTYTLTDISKY